MRILVTGGAGFIGSHLVDYFMDKGHEVICVDSFFSGRKENIAAHFDKPRFRLIAHDVRKPLRWQKDEALDRIYHLACPASPVQYQFDPILTMETSVFGTQNMLNLARKTGARLLYTSTSEVYGDPLEHPQNERYFGNVDCLGKRACYDEGKRAAESLCKDYHEQYGVDARIVRLFNTYGPRMMFNDGRVLSNFILQALLGEDITVHGAGAQTRSFMYIDDLISALEKRMEIAGDDWRPAGVSGEARPDNIWRPAMPGEARIDDIWRPVNLGNPDERRIIDLAIMVKEKIQSASRIVHMTETEMPGRAGDPQRRCPDITRAKQLLQWEPRVEFDMGLSRTISDFQRRLQHRPHLLVFSTTYHPITGPAEEAVAEIIRLSPGWEFDIVTARMDPALPEESHEGRVHIYRIGSGKPLDKWLLPILGAWRARSLHRTHHYQIAWAIMASYGAAAATIFSWILRTRVPFLLSVYEGDITETMLRRGRFLAPLYRLLFRRAHRWQVIGRMTDLQRAWLEDERHVQAVNFPPKDGSASGGDKNWDLLAKRTKELFQEIEILSTRL